MGRSIRFERKRDQKNKQPRKWPATLAVAFTLIFYVSFSSIGKYADTYPVLESGLFKLPSSSDSYAINFAMCGSGRRINCVVDGDTFYLDGHSIRVADIDTPETHQARCSYEANLGSRATRRFIELLNAGPFIVKSIPYRDEDQYGRKLRTVHRNNRSLGAILVAEGLARVWEGHRRSWCMNS
ncbi:MAG: nuclease [Rhodobiaceae bacterium]|nr:MAG: nuclease [Rhodobiaceae bacterium]